MGSIIFKLLLGSYWLQAGLGKHKLHGNIPCIAEVSLLNKANFCTRVEDGVGEASRVVPHLPCLRPHSSICKGVENGELNVLALNFDNLDATKTVKPTY